MELLSLTDISQKGSKCSSCPYRLVGQGFGPDHVPAHPKIAFLAEALGETEMIERAPLVGATGRMFFHSLLEPCGLTRDDVILANVLKCHPVGPKGESNAYPIGEMRKGAEKACRSWDGTHQIRRGNEVELVDGGLNSFNPNLAMLTVHPSFVSRTWSILRVAQADIQKAMRLVDRGYRVLVLLGSVAQGLVLPDLEGGTLKWRGHYQEINWPELTKKWES